MSKFTKLDVNFFKCAVLHFLSYFKMNKSIKCLEFFYILFFDKKIRLCVISNAWFFSAEIFSAFPKPFNWTNNFTK